HRPPDAGKARLARRIGLRQPRGGVKTTASPARLSRHLRRGVAIPVVRAVARTNLPGPMPVAGKGETMARIAVGGFHHETNCFVPDGPASAVFASHRARPPLVRGSDVIEWLGNTSFALSGFLRDMSGQHEIVPLLWTSGGAGGPVTADAYERIAGELIGRL